LKLAIALGGTDFGRSGISTYLRALLPRLGQRLERAGGRLIAIGTRRDLDAYAEVLDTIDVSPVAAWVNAPAISAAWHLARIGAHARSVGANALLLPAANRRVALYPGLPTVGVVHDLAPFNVRRKFDRLRTLYVRQFLPKVLSSFTALVAVSEATRADVARVLRWPPQKVHVIQNGVDADRFRLSIEAVAVARARLGLEAPYVLYPARLEHPGKNHLRLLRAYASSPVRRSHLLALSGADWGAQALLQAECTRLGISERVRFLGYVDEPLLPGLMGGADAVLAVGLCEGFGLPALEALAAGRPVVAARAGALPEVVGSLGILCDPLDPADMAAALSRAVSDARLAGQLRTLGPAHARQRSWDQTCDRLFSLCRTVGQG